jgi:hypothetical protein
MYQPTATPELSKDPLFAYWKSGEELVGPCDGCGSTTLAPFHGASKFAQHRRQIHTADSPAYL